MTRAPRQEVAATFLPSWKVLVQALGPSGGGGGGGPEGPWVWGREGTLPAASPTPPGPAGGGGATRLRWASVSSPVRWGRESQQEPPALLWGRGSEHAGPSETAPGTGRPRAPAASPGVGDDGGTRSLCRLSPPAALSPRGSQDQPAAASLGVRVGSKPPGFQVRRAQGRTRCSHRWGAPIATRGPCRPDAQGRLL